MHQDATKTTKKSPTPDKKELTKPAETSSKEEKLTETSNAVEEPAPIRPAVPRLKGTPKLSDFMQKKPVEEKEEKKEVQSKWLNENDVKLDLNKDNLQIIWSDFAAKVKDEQPRIFNTLMSQKPTLDEMKISFQVNNPLQIKMLNSIHHELEAYLRIRTSTPELTLDAIVSENLKTTRRAITNDEKYNHLKTLNPSLDMYKKNLNLDYE